MNGYLPELGKLKARGILEMIHHHNANVRYFLPSIDNIGYGKVLQKSCFFSFPVGVFLLVLSMVLDLWIDIVQIWFCLAMSCSLYLWSLKVPHESNEQTFMYYVNDGVYGSFNCILYDHAHVKALLPKRPKPDEKYYSSSIWGPTCDGLDRIVERCNLPEMHVGDWMLFENMGAYTVGAASTFNGFQRPSIYYVMSRSLWQLMKQIQSHGFPPEVEEQNVGALPLSCAQESGMDRHPASCAAASINV
ncbi:hypothetical protein STEG23_000813 [Scotinomys teguina]